MTRRRGPTDEQRRMVRAFAGFGVPQPDIATHLGIDPKTLRRNFREELDRGLIEANAKVAQSLFRMATEGNNVAAAIFWMKARGRWREVHMDQPDTAPLQVVIRRFDEPPCQDGSVSGDDEP
ncbi:MAG: hypothetical protein AB7F35_27630 [Acetobacteraceae bacterium]